MSEEGNKPRWEIKANQLLLVAGVIGAVGYPFYRWIWPSDARATATCRSAQIKLPNQPVLSDDWFKKTREESLTTATGDTGLTKLATQHAVDRLLERVKMELTLFKINGPAFHVACSVSNTGGRQAASLKLTLPVPIVEARFAGGQPTRANPVDLGDLLPGEKKDLDIWLGNNLMWQQRNIVLAHTEGQGVVEFPTEVYGWTAWLVGMFWPTLFAVTTTLMLIALIKAFGGSGSPSNQKRADPPP